MQTFIGLAVAIIIAIVVISPRVKENLLTKHLFIFASISALAYSHPHHDMKAAFFSVMFILLGIVCQNNEEWIRHENKRYRTKFNR